MSTFHSWVTKSIAILSVSIMTGGGLILTQCLGCRSQVLVGADVTGSVYLDGQPLSTGVVILQNVVTGQGLSATVDSGRFKFSVPVPKGTYKVAIQKQNAGSPLAESGEQKDRVEIPKRYFDPSTSQLQVDIDEKNQDLSIELSSKGSTA